MLRISSFCILALCLLISGCVGSATSVATPTQKPASTSSGFPPMSCTSVSSGPQKDYLPSSVYGAVTSADWVRGSSDAQITLVEYADFQCASCRELAQTLAQLEAKYPNELRVVFRHYPLIGDADQPIHDKAATAAVAAEAAGRQGKFWEMHDLLYSKQADWASLSAPDFESWLLDQASSLGIKSEQFVTDFQDPSLMQLAIGAWQHGQEIKINTSPFILFSGVPYTGPIDFYSLDRIVQLQLLSARQFTECPAMELEAGVDYTATLHTEKGDIVIALFPNSAPKAVNSFIFLAEHDWFDNVTFHRVIPGFVAQAGDPSGTGYGNPGYTFAIEIDPDLRFDRPGLLAMANSGPTSNGSQFFITFKAAVSLNGQFTIFGEVVSGMDVVESLTPRDPEHQAGLPPGDLILDVTIEVH